ncbi:hypothetical protein MMC17_000681 [Xylographa soralifera]|nr:hypothetical protein [Xylographa soralifera]
MRRPISNVNDVPVAGGQCMFVAPRRKRPRKRTDARVAELEREGLQISEHDETNNKDKAGTKDCDLDVDSEEDPAISAHEESALPRPQSTNIRTPATSSSPSALKSDEFGDFTKTYDVVDRGVISMNTAAALVALFIIELGATFLGRYLLEHCTAFELPVTKPVLFLAVVAAASLGGDSKLSHTLYKEIIRVYADRIIIKGEKSSELVQSLLVTVAYSYIPESAAHLQFYQFYQFRLGKF